MIEKLKLGRISKMYDSSYQNLAVYIDRLRSIYPELHNRDVDITINECIKGNADFLVSSEIAEALHFQFLEAKNLIALTDLAREKDLDTVEFRNFVTNSLDKNEIYHTENVFNDPSEFYFKKIGAENSKSAANKVVWAFLKEKARCNDIFEAQITVRRNNSVELKKFHIFEEVQEFKGWKKGRVIGFTKSRGGEILPIVSRFNGEILVEHCIEKFDNYEFVHKTNSSSKKDLSRPTVRFKLPLKTLTDKNMAFFVNIFIDSLSNRVFTQKLEGDVFYIYLFQKEKKQLLFDAKKFAEMHANDICASKVYGFQKKILPTKIISEFFIFVKKIADYIDQIDVVDKNQIFVQSNLCPLTIYLPIDDYRVICKEFEYYRDMYDSDLDDSEIIWRILYLIQAYNGLTLSDLLYKLSSLVGIFSDDFSKNNNGSSDDEQ